MQGSRLRKRTGGFVMSSQPILENDSGVLAVTGRTDAEDNGVQGVDSLVDSNGSGADSAHPLPNVSQLPAFGPEMNALKHGRHSRRLQEDAAPWRAAQVASIKEDLGQDVSTLKAHAIEQTGHVLVVLRFLGENLAAAGPLTGKGRTRAATTAYLQTLDRFMRLAQLLGLERVAKQVPSPADWIEGKA